METYWFIRDFWTTSELDQQSKYFPGMWLTHVQVIPIQSRDLESLTPVMQGIDLFTKTAVLYIDCLQLELLQFL